MEGGCNFLATEEVIGETKPHQENQVGYFVAGFEGLMSYWRKERCLHPVAQINLDQFIYVKKKSCKKGNSENSSEWLEKLNSRRDEKPIDKLAKTHYAKKKQKEKKT